MFPESEARACCITAAVGMCFQKNPISVQDGNSWNFSLLSVKGLPDLQAFPALPGVTVTHRAGPADSVLGTAGTLPLWHALPSPGGQCISLRSSSLCPPGPLLLSFLGAPAPAWGLGLLREGCVAPQLALEERGLKASAGPEWAHSSLCPHLQRHFGTR